MIKVFLPMSGNVGDTLNVMPVLSGLYKTTGNQIHLVIVNKMKMFNGLVDFLQMQPCISAVNFLSDVCIDETYLRISLPYDYTKHPNRPWETVRYDEDLRRRSRLQYDVDDAFEFVVPDIDTSVINDKFVVGDRMAHRDMDQRRKFNVLKSLGKLPIDRCYFLDYNQPMAINAAYIKATTKPFITTFTGISVISDLLRKEAIVLWGEDLRNWDNKPIKHSFNKHFYRDRFSRLMYLGDFDIDQL